MNTFATLENLKHFTFKKVKYYSIRINNASTVEFIDFLTRMENDKDHENDLNNLFEWLEIIGNTQGAKSEFFRPEGYVSDATALPPPLKIMEAYEIIVEDIRLYCLRLNESVVILFNGGIKTKQKSQDCPNVSKYFKQANIFSKKINALFGSNDISWNSNYTDIVFNEDLIIEI